MLAEESLHSTLPSAAKISKKGSKKVDWRKPVVREGRQGRRNDTAFTEDESLMRTLVKDLVKRRLPTGASP